MGRGKIYFLASAAVMAVVWSCGSSFGQDRGEPAAYGFLGGANFTTYSNHIAIAEVPDGLDTGVGTSLGIYGRWPIAGRFYAFTSGYYALHSGVSRNPFYRLRNHHVGAMGLVQYRLFDDVFLQTGAEYIHLFRSNFFESKTLIESGTAGLANPWSFDHQWNPVVGFEIKMAPSASVSINYVHPVGANHTRGVQVNLVIAINQGNQGPGPRKLARQKANEDINQLREGTLLVRLSTREQSIAALEQEGYVEEARKMRMQQEKVNEAIMAAFRSYFDFCKVEFFLSQHSQKVRQGDWENLFLGDSARVDSSIKINPLKPVYTAEFGNIRQGEVSGELNFAALVIMDQQFAMLEKPFPYYMRAMNVATGGRADKTLLALPLLPFTPMTYSDAVERMNRALHQFYRQAGPH